MVNWEPALVTLPSTSYTTQVRAIQLCGVFGQLSHSGRQGFNAERCGLLLVLCYNHALSPHILPFITVIGLFSIKSPVSFHMCHVNRFGVTSFISLHIAVSFSFALLSFQPCSFWSNVIWTLMLGTSMSAPVPQNPIQWSLRTTVKECVGGVMAMVFKCVCLRLIAIQRGSIIGFVFLGLRRGCGCFYHVK